jgi:carbon-monoxide dehydrogenase small subunit
VEATATAVTYVVNGATHSLTLEGHETLADVLRGRLGLTGTKLNCRQGECGACTVMIDGESVNSCIVLAASVDGAEITTIEGLSEGGRPGVVQRAFMETDGSQCGFCTPGMIVTAEALLRHNPDPSEEDILDALGGNLCRCTGYRTIREAVELAAARKSSA